MGISIFSFFSGSGLLDLAFEHPELDFNIVLVNEYNKSFLDAYKYVRKIGNLPAPMYGHYCCDINDFLQKEDTSSQLRLYVAEQRKIGNIVGFIGGPPCPDFSVGGKNQGRDGQNGVLAKSYIDLIIKHKPDFFFFENVTGLVKTAKHKEYFNELKSSLQSAGYIISDTVLNSLSFGVPQDRERVVMIGIQNTNKLSIPITNSGELMFPWLRYALFDADEVKMLDWPKEQPYKEKSRRSFKYQVPKVLTVQHWFTVNNVRRHPNAKDVFQVKAGKAKMLQVFEGDTSRKSFKRLHRWRYSPTAAYGNNEVHLHPYETRRLSVSEVMAIQSLPDWFCLPTKMSLTHKFKTIGNGVPYLMALAISRAINDFLHDIFGGVNKRDG